MRITRRQLRKIISEAVRLNEQYRRGDDFDEIDDDYEEPRFMDDDVYDEEVEDTGDWDDAPNERRPLLPGNRNSSW